jgi:hypothetical protein
MDLEFLLKKANKEEKKEEVEWEAAPIMNCSYYDS